MKKLTSLQKHFRLKSKFLAAATIVAFVALAGAWTTLPAAAQWPKTYRIDAKNLPKPFANKSKIITPILIPQSVSVKLHLPPGFKATIFAEGLTNPRWLAVAPNGDVFCVESRIEMRVQKQAHDVIVLRDGNGDGKVDKAKGNEANPDTRTVFTDQLNLPFGIAFHNGFLYIANTGSVVRWPYRDGQTQAEGQPQMVIDHIPERGYNQHWTRNILFSPAGDKLYLTIGSLANIGVEEARRAAISQYALNAEGLPEGKPMLYATGLRNPIGLAFNPRTGALWSNCNERDYMGDELVPDFLTQIKPGGFYGWPYFYIGANRDPRVPARPDLKSKVLIPDVLFQAHSSPIGLCFYTSKQFPTEYRGDAFVAMHGSTNRRHRTGYKVVRIHFDAKGRPVGGYQDFVTGWMLGESKREVWGRPAGLALAPDGSLLIADDAGGKIWRVSYAAAKATEQLPRSIPPLPSSTTLGATPVVAKNTIPSQNESSAQSARMAQDTTDLPANSSIWLTSVGILTVAGGFFWCLRQRS